MKVWTFTIKTHRILGRLLSILFLMWFVSGLVMMYHSYPKVDRNLDLMHAESVDTISLVNHATLDSIVRSSSCKIKNISLYRRGGMELFCLVTDMGKLLLDAGTGASVERLTEEQLQQVANHWVAPLAKAARREVLSEIDVWLIGAYPFKDYPVYHYDLPGEERAELYLSSRTGETLQYTTRASRFWAWVGAIPHWIYVKQFRAQGRQPWTDIVLWLSGIGILVTACGLIIGVRVAWMAHRKGKGLSLYKRRMFRYHHL